MRTNTEANYSNGVVATDRPERIGFPREGNSIKNCRVYELESTKRLVVHTSGLPGDLEGAGVVVLLRTSHQFVVARFRTRSATFHLHQPHRRVTLDKIPPTGPPPRMVGGCATRKWALLAAESTLSSSLPWRPLPSPLRAPE